MRCITYVLCQMAVIGLCGGACVLYAGCGCAKASHAAGAEQPPIRLAIRIEPKELRTIDAPVEVEVSLTSTSRKIVLIPEQSIELNDTLLIGAAHDVHRAHAAIQDAMDSGLRSVRPFAADDEAIPAKALRGGESVTVRFSGVPFVVFDTQSINGSEAGMWSVVAAANVAYVPAPGEPIKRITLFADPVHVRIENERE